MFKCLQIVCAKNYELRYVLKSFASSNLARWLRTASKFALFSVSGLTDGTLIKRQTCMKTENANPILESSEHFCQMSSKSILIISSYTVVKMVPFAFLRHTVETCQHSLAFALGSRPAATVKKLQIFVSLIENYSTNTITTYLYL